jgi:hypothetical protein
MITIPDISDYYNNYDILLLLFAIFFVDVVVVFLVRYFPVFFGKTLNDWYNNFGFTAILSDILIILLGFIIARYIYTTWIKPTYGWNPLIFLALLVAIQVVHDILFYIAIILPIPIGHNEVIDLFKKYSRAGPKIIGGDALLMLASALVAFYYKSQPSHVAVTASVFALYNATYILYTKPTMH